MAKKSILRNKNEQQIDNPLNYNLNNQLYDIELSYNELKLLQNILSNTLILLEKVEPEIEHIQITTMIKIINKQVSICEVNNFNKAHNTSSIIEDMVILDKIKQLLRGKV
jgi:hypothetical protein